MRNTITGPEAIRLLARHITSADGAIHGLTVLGPPTSGAPVAYHDLEFVQGSLLGWDTEFNLPKCIKFVARGRNGQGPFAFVWPATGVNPDQPACNGLAAASITVW